LVLTTGIRLPGEFVGPLTNLVALGLQFKEQVLVRYRSPEGLEKVAAPSGQIWKLLDGEVSRPQDLYGCCSGGASLWREPGRGSGGSPQNPPALAVGRFSSTTTFGYVSSVTAANIGFLVNLLNMHSCAWLNLAWEER